MSTKRKKKVLVIFTQVQETVELGYRDKRMYLLDQTNLTKRFDGKHINNVMVINNSTKKKMD